MNQYFVTDDYGDEFVCNDQKICECGFCVVVSNWNLLNSSSLRQDEFACVECPVCDRSVQFDITPLDYHEFIVEWEGLNRCYDAVVCECGKILWASKLIDEDLAQDGIVDIKCPKCERVTPLMYEKVEEAE